MDKFNDLLSNAAAKCGISLSPTNVNELLKYKNNTSAITPEILKKILGPKKIEKIEKSGHSFIDIITIVTPGKKKEEPTTAVSTTVSTTASTTASTTESEASIVSEHNVVPESASASTAEVLEPETPTDSEPVMESGPATIIDSQKIISTLQSSIDEKVIELYKDKLLNTTTNNVIAMKDELIAAKDTLIMQKDNLLMQKDNLLMNKDNIIIDLENKIKEKEKIIECQLETIQRLIKSHENINPFRPAAIEEQHTVDEVASIFIEKYTEDYAKVYGKTFGQKDLIKEVGGVWSTSIPDVKDGKGWVIPASRIDELKEIFTKNKIVFRHIIEETKEAEE
jgi:hypothetical protein